jgi:hypothetical protein
VIVTPDNSDGGDYAPINFGLPISTCVDDETYAENVRSALSRGLPEVRPRKPHSYAMSIAAGGPSLADTYGELKGVICAVNGSLSFLLSRGVTPWAVGVMDPRAHMADVVERREGVFYFLASTCHPRLFDKLAGCDIGLWHPSGMRGIETLVPEDSYLIGGGTTMGLRWLNIGHFLGFREFHAHGLDSSFRGQSTHAYADHTDGDEAVFTVKGYRTRQNFVQQIVDWTETKAMFARMPVEDHPKIKLYGDGLLQYCEREGVC